MSSSNEPMRALEKVAQAPAKYVVDDLQRRFGGRTVYDLIRIIAQMYPDVLRPLDPADLCHIAAEAYGAVAKAA